MRYGFEVPVEERIRVGFIGCGGHSFRNIYPCLQYAPVELVAVCDLNEARGATYARLFGAARAYRDYEEMLRQESLAAVFVVTNYGDDGLPQFPGIAIAAMEAGCHTWIEKPPAGSASEIERMIRVSARTGRFVQVGFKKMFVPALERLWEITRSPEFGRRTSAYVRYPQAIPPVERRSDDRAMLGFLDHIFHPGSVVQYLMGPVRTLYYEQAENGGTVSALTFASGGVGTLHLCAGQSGTSPLERVEVVGEGSNAVVENGIRLVYYRRGGRGPGGYGRARSFVGDDTHAPIVWEPEFSLGQLYNKGLFLIGYAPEVLYFCECVRRNEPPAKAGLRDALDIMRLYEAYRFHPPGHVIELPPPGNE
jgi:predicted dehydrogenase